MTTKWIAYIPDDGHWQIPGEWTNVRDATAALRKMLKIARVPPGTVVSRDK